MSQTSHIVRIATWGRRGLGTIAVRVEAGEPPIDAAPRGIDRRTGLQVCGCRSDSVAPALGSHPEAAHYQITLGRPLPRRLGGGWSVEGELWAAIPVSGGAS